jgi:hypothetical protein
VVFSLRALPCAVLVVRAVAVVRRPQCRLGDRLFLAEIHITLMLMQEGVLGELLDQVFHYSLKVELGGKKLCGILCCLSLVMRLLFLI